MTVGFVNGQICPNNRIHKLFKHCNNQAIKNNQKGDINGRNCMQMRS